VKTVLVVVAVVEVLRAGERRTTRTLLRREPT